MNELDVLPTMATTEPQRVFADNRAECRQCRAHVRLGYRNANTAAAWCSVCCTTSIYDVKATATAR